MNPDSRHTARLLFAGELASGLVGQRDLERPEVAAAAHARPVPRWPMRMAQRLGMKAGRLDYERSTLPRIQAARQAVLGPAALDQRPRLLVRVDEFPHYLAGDQPERYGTAKFRRFQEILKDAGVAHLVAVVPRPATTPLDPQQRQNRPLDAGEQAMLDELANAHVALGLHGYDHRTRHRKPRRHSELCGLPRQELELRLDRAIGALEDMTVRPRVFVPPFNRFDPHQYPVLARRFDVVTGGPETVPLFGYHRPPCWRGEAVYLPCYPPLYGKAATILPAVQRIMRHAGGVWVPIVLHWGWEADAGWRDLRRLAERIAPATVPWDDLLDAMTVSRQSQ